MFMVLLVFLQPSKRRLLTLCLGTRVFQCFFCFLWKAADLFETYFLFYRISFKLKPKNSVQALFLSCLKHTSISPSVEKTTERTTYSAKTGMLRSSVKCIRLSIAKYPPLLRLSTRTGICFIKTLIFTSG